MKNIVESISKLKKISDKLYEGAAIGSFNAKQLFGGSLVAHGVAAGYEEVPKGFYIHNIHSYYVKLGKPQIPINYHIKEVVKTKNFHKIFLVAQQNNETLARFSMSFKVQEKSNSFSYEPPYANITDFRKLMTFDEVLKHPKKVCPYVLIMANNFKNWLTDFPFILKPVMPEMEPSDAEPSMSYWFQVKPELGFSTNDMSIKNILMAFLSDFGVIYPIIVKHPRTKVGFVTSLDHNIWFHCNDCKIDQHFLYENRCLVSRGSLTLNIGRIWSETGQILVTSTQQGLLREVSTSERKQSFPL